MQRSLETRAADTMINVKRHILKARKNQIFIHLVTDSS
jgi:hypothetical protein